MSARFGVVRFGVAVLVVGMAVALGAFAYLLDHARASAVVVRGLGEAAEPELTLALEEPPVEDEDTEVGLQPARGRDPVAVARTFSGLEVRATNEAGRYPAFADVLAYRGSELIRAGTLLGKGA